MTTMKIGSVRSQSRAEETIGGNSRSDRRCVSGPDLDVGAAIRVRCCDKRRENRTENGNNHTVGRTARPSMTKSCL